MSSIFLRNITEVIQNVTKNLEVGNFKIHLGCHMPSLHFSETNGRTVMTIKARGIMYSLAMYYLSYSSSQLFSM